METSERTEMQTKAQATPKSQPAQEPAWKVVFKCEDFQGEMEWGPVTIIEMAVYKADPEIRKAAEQNLIGIPYGYKPQGIIEMGWCSEKDAERIASEYGVSLTYPL